MKFEKYLLGFISGLFEKEGVMTAEWNNIPCWKSR